MRVSQAIYLLLLFLAIAVPMRPASGAILVYTDRAAFLAALATSVNQDFNSIPSGYVAAPKSFSQDPFDYTVHVYDENWSPLTGNNLYSYTESVGNQALGELSTYNHIEFTYESANISAFGGNFFGSDFMGDLDPSATLTFDLNDSGGFSNDLEYVSSNPTGTSFLGFITDQASFNFVDITASFTDYTTFDNLTIGSTVAVPEPATCALLGLGLGLGIAALRRRTRNRG